MATFLWDNLKSLQSVASTSLEYLGVASTQSQPNNQRKRILVLGHENSGKKTLLYTLCETVSNEENQFKIESNEYGDTVLNMVLEGVPICLTVMGTSTDSVNKEFEEYLIESDGIIFMVDTQIPNIRTPIHTPPHSPTTNSDTNSNSNTHSKNTKNTKTTKHIQKSKSHLESLLQNKKISNQIPFIILGNKYEKARKYKCINEKELRKIFGLTYTTGKTQKNQNSNSSSNSNSNSTVNDKKSGNYRCIEVYMCSVKKRSGFYEPLQWLVSYMN